MPAPWTVEHHVGDAAEFHAREPGAARAAWWFDVDAPTLVLGSAQRAERVDRRVVDALGIRVVRRRSGGGAVLLWPGEFVWLDLIVPASDVLWVDDVGRSMHWAGELWAEALDAVGVAGLVHRGGLVSGPWGREVCFAGVGPGEVTAGPRKLVGVSQRRTRGWARLQTMCHLRVRPELVAALVAPPRPTSGEVAATVTAVEVDRGELVTGLTTALHRR